MHINHSGLIERDENIDILPFYMGVEQSNTL
jgi:hypothetical protein